MKSDPFIFYFYIKKKLQSSVLRSMPFLNKTLARLPFYSKKLQINNILHNFTRFFYNIFEHLLLTMEIFYFTVHIQPPLDATSKLLLLTMEISYLTVQIQPTLATRNALILTKWLQLREKSR